MARHGVSPEHLVAAGCFAAPTRPAPAAIRYRGANGQSWDGEGTMPDWLRRAVNAGQNAEHFRVGT
ncbi:H-NS family nucleoid-associated regulatory protein [Cupriavidus sp. CuC1]|uniref:H-NS family nucleoid-associated regulatory protein n=1 Tax=Cupriavidus sp. CuC1 TaxID=3373131 RepID=UPI0037CE669F